MYDVIVIGGGPAGVTAALRASELGATVALVEQAQLGGTCTTEGCAPTRVMAKTARLMRDSEHFEDFGLTGERPHVDFPALMERTRQTTERLHDKKQLEQHLARAGVDVRLNTGYASFADPHTIRLERGPRLEGRSFIICAGGRARQLSFPGSEHAITYTEVWKLSSLPRSVAIFGGAATGCQLGSIFAELGSEVTILERGPRLLAREDRLVSDSVAQAFEQRGIQHFLGAEALERIESTSNGLTIFYKHLGSTHQKVVDAVVLAVGWPSNADTLNLAVAGVETDRGYVVVDGYLRTTAPHIFAAGDINGQMMLVQSASYEGRIAAENAVLGVGQRYVHSIVPHGGFTDPEYASVGLTEEEARAVESDCLVAVVPYTDLDRAVIDDRTVGYCKLIVSQDSHRILGAHIVGEQALEAIQLVAAGMVADMWVEHLAELELAYPTYTSIVGLAARRLVRELGVMPMAATWQALGTPHLAEWERSEA
jgi:pyruvate/2-oxoglutarate dehydrogenase complex dihydrolipoamide dehydrogenase (E3) component